MIYRRRWAGAVVLAWFTCAQGSAQYVPAPGSVVSLLRQQCPICRLHPSDSLLAAANDDYGKNFHNSLVCLQKNYLDEAYQYTVQAAASPDSDRYLSLSPYLMFIRARVLYAKHLYKGAAAAYLRLQKTPGLDSALLSNVYAILGEIHLEASEFTLALGYFDTWQKWFLRSADYGSLKNYYLNKALCLFHLKKYAESEKMFLQNIGIGQQHDDTLGLAISYMNLANLYYEQYLDRKAIPAFERSLQLARRAGDVKLLGDACLNMAVVEENRKHYQAALGYRKEYEQLHDSLWNRDNIWNLSAREKQFVSRLDENRIQLLKQDALLRTAELKTKSLERNMLLFSTAGFIMISMFSYYAYRVKAKANRVIARQKEELALLNTTKDRLFSIVAHDLRSPVYSLKNHVALLRSALAENKLSAAKQVSVHMEKTVNSTYNLLDNMLHWALSQAGQMFFRPERIYVPAVISQVCYDFSILAMTKEIGLCQEATAPVFIVADIHSVKIILRNLLDNAIKYSHPGTTIKVSAEVKENKCCIQVKDTGIGMSAEMLAMLFSGHAGHIREDTEGKRGTGFGLGLCKMLAEKNRGSIEVKSLEAAGTEISIYFPLTSET